MAPQMAPQHLTNSHATNARRFASVKLHLRRHAVLYIGLVAAISMLPLLSSSSLYFQATGDSRATLSSTALYTATVLSTAAAAGLFLDSVFDPYDARGQTVTHWLLVLILFAYGVAVLGFSLPFQDMPVLWLAHCMRDMGGQVAMLHCLQHNVCVQWGEARVVIMALLVCAGKVTKAYSGTLLSTTSPLATISLTFTGVGCMLILAQCYFSVRGRSWSLMDEQGAVGATMMGTFVAVIVASYILVAITSPLDVADTSAAFICVTTALNAVSVAFVCGVCMRLRQRAAVALTVEQAGTAKLQVLQAELTTKRDVVRYLSHEVRTPLNTASLGLSLTQQLLETVTQAVAAAANNLSTMDRTPVVNHTLEELRHVHGQLLEISSIAVDTTESLSIGVSILNDLLTYEKIEGGILELDAHVAPINPLLVDTVRIFSPQARASGITMSLYIDARMIVTQEDARHAPDSASVSVLMDTSKISQVIRNLISNAIKFSAPGAAVHVKAGLVARGSPLDSVARASSTCKPGTSNETPSCFPADCDSSARWTEAAKPTHWRLQVQDEGVGLTVVQQRRLFGEIVQFNPGKLQNGGGSGLGLYIAYGIVQKHGGTMTVYSAGEGLGTTFAVELPIHDAFAPCLPGARVVLPALHSETAPAAPDEPQSVQSSPLHYMPQPSSIGDLTVDTHVCLSPLAGGTMSGRTTSTPRCVHNHDDQRTRATHSQLLTGRTANGSFSSVGTGACVLTRTSATAAHLPAEITKHDELASLPRSLALPITDSVATSMRVLLADDSSATRKMISRMLRLNSVCSNAEEASDGDAALALILATLPHPCDSLSSGRRAASTRTQPYDLILLDAMMPTMSGLMTVQHARAAGYTGLILGLTGNARTEDIAAFVAAGADGVLTKPLTVETMLAGIRAGRITKAAQSLV